MTGALDAMNPSLPAPRREIETIAGERRFRTVERPLARSGAIRYPLSLPLIACRSERA